VELPLDKDIQVCLNEFPGVTNVHTLIIYIRVHNFLQVYIANTFENLTEYINIWHGTSLGPGDSSLLK